MHQVVNRTGLEGYSVGYAVDHDRGGHGLTEPGKTVELDSATERTAITIEAPWGSDALPDGATVVVWLSVLDAGEPRDVQKLSLGIDRSAATIGTDSFITSSSSDQFMSRYVCVFSAPADRRFVGRRVAYSVVSAVVVVFITK